MHNNPSPNQLAQQLLHMQSEINDLRLRVEHGCGRQHSLDTQSDLQQAKLAIMSAISEFATRQNQFNDRIDAAITGVSADVDALNAEIVKLQNTPGIITPEDQALLDGIQARSQTVADKLEALDALTPPVPPVA